MDFKVVEKPYYALVSDLLNLYVSFGLTTSEKVKELAEQNHAYMVLDNQKLVGCITIKNIPDLSETLLHHGDLIKLLNNQGTYPLMLIHQMVVLPEYRKNGIGSDMLKGVLSMYPYRSFLAIGWKPPQGCPADTLLRNHGFAVLTEKEHFWQKDSLKHGYSCPYCERGCDCTAIIYFRA